MYYVCIMYLYIFRSVLWHSVYNKGIIDENKWFKTKINSNVPTYFGYFMVEIMISQGVFFFDYNFYIVGMDLFKICIEEKQSAKRDECAPSASAIISSRNYVWLIINM